MARVLADLPDEDLEKLDALVARQKRSRASALRDAVKLYLAHNDNSKDWIERWAGLWADRDDIPDGVEYQRAIRDDRRPYEDI